MSAIAQKLIEGYPMWLLKHRYEQTDFSHVAEYMQSDDAKAILAEGTEELRKKLEALKPTDEELNGMASKIVSGYESYADSHELPSASYLVTSFSKYLATDGGKLGDQKRCDPMRSTPPRSGKACPKYSGISEQLSSVMTKVMSRCPVGSPPLCNRAWVR